MKNKVDEGKNSLKKDLNRSIYREVLGICATLIFGGFLMTIGVKGIITEEKLKIFGIAVLILSIMITTMYTLMLVENIRIDMRQKGDFSCNESAVKSQKKYRYIKFDIDDFKEFSLAAILAFAGCFLLVVYFARVEIAVMNEYIPSSSIWVLSAFTVYAVRDLFNKEKQRKM